MISRHTSNVLKEDVVFPRLLYSDSRCSQACRWRSQTFCRRSQTFCRRCQAGRRHSLTCRRRSLIVDGAPWLVASAPWLVAGAPWCSQVLPKFSPALRGILKLITITPMVLLYQSSEIPVTPKAGRNALRGSDTLLKLTHLSLHSTSSQTLLEASSD